MTTSYNTGPVSGHDDVGGVVGYNYLGTVTDTYYNTSFTALGIGGGTSGSATGLSEGTSSGDLGNSESYTSWSFASGWNGTGFGTPGTWIIGTVYPNGGTSGIPAPILVSDLPTATVTGNSGTSVYSGSTVSPGYTTTYTMGASAIPTGITVTAPAPFGPNAGSDTVTPTVSGTFAQPTTQTSLNMVISSGRWTITALPVTATANTATMTYGGTVPTLSGTFSTTAQTGGLANLFASWTTPATYASNVGSYAVNPGTYSYKNGAVSGDYTITEASGNATALTVTASPQIVPEYQTVLGFDNVVTPSEAPASTASSGSSPSPVPSGSATPLLSSGASSLTIILPTEDGMTGEGIISYETVTPSKRP